MDKKLVYFKDLLEDNPTPHFGYLLSDGTVECMCCGGTLEEEDYEIICTFEENAVQELVNRIIEEGC